MIYNLINSLINYAEEKKLIEKEDRIWATNSVISILGLDEYKEPALGTAPVTELEDILKGLCDFAVEKDLIPDTTVYRDLFDTKLMGVLTPRPSTVIKEFNRLYEISPEAATDYFYDFSQNTDYIRRYRIKKDMRWTTETEYGTIDISVNLSKPEKDPKDIAAAKNAPKSGYPACLLCRENEGYAGRVNSPARQNHRIIPMTINNTPWMMQYSPYVYYNEHCIVFNSQHTPMSINPATFSKLLDFVTLFPHYFVGSNADLPIVGGSILSHDHFQGGRYDFAMAKADIKVPVTFEGYEDVEAGIVNWPMSVIRIAHESKDKLIALASHILAAWRGYTDETAFIFAETNCEKHNTITPIARMRNGKYELDLVLRNNITTDEHPAGVYHPHAEYHNIKKENIGLIEVMGLAILPARLKNEIVLIKKYILDGMKAEDEKGIEHHLNWVKEFVTKYEEINEGNVEEIIKNEIGIVFSHVLECAGVYKNTPESTKRFIKFIEFCGGKQA